MKRTRKHIELFAGCGGLCLGLESEGLKLLFANELSPMAGETFAYNILGEDLKLLSQNSPPVSAKHTIWLNSRFRSDAVKKRLNENPQDPPLSSERHDERPLSAIGLSKKLVIGSIVDLNDHLEAYPSLGDELRAMDIDLVSGGPPCQSFSMAGMRQRDNQRNQLPWEFARFVNITRPKIAVLENVTGILHAFQEKDGSASRKYYAWHEVAKAFASIEYHPICLHVNAKYSGVAQNRPRFIMFALRSDVYEGIRSNPELETVISNSEKFCRAVEANHAVSLEESGLRYWDTSKDAHIFTSRIFAPFKQFTAPCSSTDKRKHWHTVADAINDFRVSPDPTVNGRYISLLHDSFRPRRDIEIPKGIDIPNQNNRANGPRVRQRFRLYQVIEKMTPKAKKEVLSLIKGQITELSEETARLIDKEKFLVAASAGNQKELKLQKLDRHEVTNYVASLATKKQTQRALRATEPAPAALSIPDDACHYAEELEDIRTLSVREMARIQSFPDWFTFRSKETTGGQMRRHQVPQYTQVGNAVPPLLGKAIGKVVNRMLDESS
ncbi:MAG: DNA (cytosine-5-)-methyltransferase [Halieaceae bacterium]